MDKVAQRVRVLYYRPSTAAGPIADDITSPV